MSAVKKILVVDDDKSIGDALSRAFATKGFAVTICGKAVDALEKLKVDEFCAIFVDCMLPQLSGVDLVAKITEGNMSSSPIYLMSGVYKDKRYIKDAMIKSHAAEFITKPFNLEDVLKLVVSTTTDKTELSRPPLFRVFSDISANSRDIRKAIDSTDSIHSFDLPIVYGFLVNSGIAGHLNVVEAKGDIFGISLLPYKIISVDTNHAKSYLGALLVEKGFINHEQVDETLTMPSTRKLGTRLVEANLISPHAIFEVMADQLAIRLSKTIYDSSVSINFSESKELKDGPGIDNETFNVLLHDWILSKIPFPWLKAFYVTWMDQEIISGPAFSLLTKALQAPIYKRLPGFEKMLVSGRTVDRLLTDGNYNESDFFVAIHYLAILRVICFGARDEIKDYDAIRARLNRVLKETDGKNYFEILNLSKNARESEIKNAYYELAKIFHPDKIPKEAPKGIFDLNQKIFSLISSAFNVIKDAPSRERYLKELDQGRADELLKAEAIYERGKALLKAGRATQALEAFAEVGKFNLAKSDLTLYRVWAMLKLLETNRGSADIKKIEQQLEQIPPEDRHDAIYHFVKGLFQKQIGRTDVARGLFERAIAVDPQFIDARRELNVLRLKNETQKIDIWKSDLKDIVGLLFKSKKK
ncbi:MAG: response regulator [Pseudomonadota bacterium]|nr:response regulator [Pseudomonadota bacterium]